MNYLRWLTVGTTIILTAAPSWAASQQIEKFTIENTKQGLELKLETDSDLLPSFVTVDRGDILETTILDTELNLTEETAIQKANPRAGISQISLEKADEDRTKIIISKEPNLRLEPTLKQENSELVISFDVEKSDSSLFNQLPFSDDLIGLKNNLASLLTNKKAKDSEKETPKNTNITNDSQNDDVLVPNPEIVITNNSEGEIGTLQADNSYEQPYLPRAVAPPVGDMAVSNISTFPDTVDLGTGAIVPRLVLRDAPVREVLSLLARQAGLNIVFAIEGEEDDDEDVVEGPTVSLDLENQSVQEVFDSILLISNLSASRRGNIIYIGEQLPAQARNLVSRTIRLNQVRAENAALFLASQGARGQRLTTEVEETVDPETGRVVQRRELPANLEDLGGAAEDEENSTNALLLRGLQIATDDRLNSITLVGEPRKVEAATAFLTQLDARRRQVAVNVKVIDVNLLNQDVFNSSFSFGINDTFYTQDNGSAILNFGDTRPPTGAQIESSQFTPAIIPFNVSGAEISPFFDVQEAPFGSYNPGGQGFTNGTAPYARPNFGTLDNPFQPGISQVTPIFGDPDNPLVVTGTEYEYSLPGLFQFPKRFLAQLEARITSGNAKILTDPTIVVQEGQESTVKLTQDIIKGIDSTINENGVTTNTPIFDEAGLTVTVNIERIDDNGFVSLSVSPTVSAIATTQEFDSGNAVNLISLLSRREVSSGLIRLRDSQTLILSGIIQDQERVAVTKVPILGDIPILGSLFRSTNKTNERAEVIVLLTPEIIDEQADFGYNYQPSKDTREMLRKGGLDLPNNPE